MDIVLPADAFPVTGSDDPTRQLPLMVDVTCFEAQVASQAQKTAADPERCCRDQEAATLPTFLAKLVTDLTLVDELSARGNAPHCPPRPPFAPPSFDSVTPQEGLLTESSGRC
ncbi:hypothetical protein JKP88DRAFT_276689 [Tribonema minus]|uniref:Uncharacterized protein n=1 Tax=Tribonema minus TaxID=303371 RepID=A0A836CGQ3_9STRA|nr:hypothetical protein JKP88DRAFT_276689 [Tribonema minus]